MSYAYGMRLDDDSNAITVIDEENQTATTTGYINGEPVDFGGGGTDLFVVRLTYDQGQYSADKTFNEIQEAYLKKPMVLISPDSVQESICWLSSHTFADESEGILEAFGFTDSVGSSYWVQSDNTVEYQPAN